MATFRRLLIPGATYFFTVVTEGRRPVLTETRFYQALKAALREVKTKMPFQIDAFVLLPDHLHCIWTLPRDDRDYAKRWNMIKRLTSQQTRMLVTTPLDGSRARRRDLGLWQRRYWEHQIRDEMDFERHADYIHWNPVKHGHAKRVRDWPYSSFHRYVRLGIYSLDWEGAAGMPGAIGE